jgi:3-hydroxyethyl bacteriochlorophyllide a dehydrogenase
MQTEAVILEKAFTLGLGTLDLTDPGPGDVVVDMHWSGISSGTEKLLWNGEMPWFPGLSYPLVPGYEGVGTVIEAGADSNIEAGETVFVPGATCYRDAAGLFGASARRVVVPAARVTRVSDELGAQAILLSLAATARHALAGSEPGGSALIVGHGVVGRLLARLLIADGHPPPAVWEQSAQRMAGAHGYTVTTAEACPEATYETIIDASGDGGLLDTLVGRLVKGGEIILAGFYAQPLSFTFAPAFMREARLRIAAEWQPGDLAAVLDHLAGGTLSLDGLISHTVPAAAASEAYRTAFNDPACTKMVLDWRQAQ